MTMTTVTLLSMLLLAGVVHSDSCISDCSGQDNGDYHSCTSCQVFVTCSNGYIHDNRPCPAGLMWDDNVKRCDWTSDTCNTGGKS